MDYSTAVTTRLPALFAALGAGQIHPFQLRIIAEETSILSDADARKLVLKLDPEAVRKRKEAAKREDSGNAGLIARELPSDEVLASWQHVEQRALDLRAARTRQP